MASLSVPSFAKNVGDTELLKQFVYARLAEASNASQNAAEGYSEALKLQSNNVLLANKAYRQAILAGDLVRATRAVRLIELNGKLAPEMPLLLYVDAIKAKNWDIAEAQVSELDKLGNFKFMAPFLRSWLAVARRKRGAVAHLETAKDDSLAKLYLRNQNVFLNMALGRKKEVAELIKPFSATRNFRSAVLRIRTAQYLSGNGMADAARKTLENAAFSAEKVQLSSLDKKRDRKRKKLSAREGLSHFFDTVSRDLWSQKVSFHALLMSRLARDIEPRNDAAIRSEAMALIANDKKQLAADSLHKIDRDSPYYVPSLQLRINTLIQLDQVEKGRAEVEQALERDPSMLELQVLAAQTYRAAEKYDEAIQSYEQTIAIGEKKKISKMTLAGLWLSLGGLQDNQKKWPDALKSLRKANELAPNNATILNYLGYSQLERRANIEDAIKLIERAHKLQPESAAITDSLGWSYFINGDYPAAIEKLELAVKGAPSDPTINEHLGDAYWKAGRRYEARYSWKNAALFVEGDVKKRLVKKADIGLRPELVAP